MYRVIKIDEDKVYLGNNKGDFITANLEDFGEKPSLDDAVKVYRNGEEVIVSVQKEALSDKVGSSNQTSTITGILHLLLESLQSHNDRVGNLRRAFSNLLLICFMSWALFGVFVVEVLLFAESLIVTIFRLIGRAFKAMNIAKHYSRWSKNRKAKQEQRDQERFELDKLDKELKTEEAKLEFLKLEEQAKKDALKVEQEKAELAAKELEAKETEVATEQDIEELPIAEQILEGDVLPRKQA